ncbi:uncharacterized protein LOC135374682 [Ornithodoros turicata]|uniref:uncharacterized protein LOC135374682 n=1 Tax=Ornithodoros turicata TaxID=34597 RepID=UPI00313954BD
MIEEPGVPFGFAHLGWVQDVSAKPKVDQVWAYLRKSTHCIRQGHRGWNFKEEGYVRNVLYNTDTDSASEHVTLVRGVCLPSMRKGGYTTTAWYQDDGTVSVCVDQFVGTVEAPIRVSVALTIPFSDLFCVSSTKLSGTCEHVAALLFHAGATKQPQVSCTDVPCAWIVPLAAKKPAPVTPLQDITFRKHLVNKVTHVKTKLRLFDPCANSPNRDNRDYTRTLKRLEKVHPSLMVLRYFPGKSVQPSQAAQPTLTIGDDEDLWGPHVSQEVDKYITSLPQLTVSEREKLCESTKGQADNAKWYSERTGRVTASNFGRVVRCTKPDYLVKQILYPRKSAHSEAIAYGREHEAEAVDAYVHLMHLYDRPVEVIETGLIVHRKYPFIAASPDRLVKEGDMDGLLEVKCPLSKRGITAEEASNDKRFCCSIVDGEVRLKPSHAYFYQVQGQMAVAEREWCDFVIWTNDGAGNGTTHVQRIDFDRSFWEEEILPGILHFVRHALVPEVLTKRIQRIGKLYTKGGYIPFGKYKKNNSKDNDGFD